MTRKKIFYRNILYALFLFLATGCSKEPIRNIVTNPSSGSGGNQGPTGNPSSRYLYLGISSDSSLFGLPTTGTTLRATAYYSDIPSIPVLSFVSWSKIQGPAGSFILSPGNLYTTISNLGAGTYVFGCSVRDTSGRSDTAAAVISVHDPALPEQETVLLNRSWVETGFGAYFNINLGQVLPPGRALRKVFLKTDCDTAFIELRNAPNDAYTYSTGYWDNTVWLHVGFYTIPGNNMCTLSPDTPDVKIVF